MGVHMCVCVWVKVGLHVAYKLASFFLLSACGFCRVPLCMQYANCWPKSQRSNSVHPSGIACLIYVTVARHSCHHHMGCGLLSCLRFIHAFCYASHSGTDRLKLPLSFFLFIIILHFPARNCTK